MNKKVLTLCAGFLLAGGMLNTVSAHLGNMVEGQYYRIDVVGAGQDAGAYSLDSDNQDATGWWCNSDAVSYDFDGSAWWTIEPVKDPVKGDVIAYKLKNKKGIYYKVKDAAGNEYDAFTHESANGAQEGYWKLLTYDGNHEVVNGNVATSGAGWGINEVALVPAAYKAETLNKILGNGFGLQICKQVIKANGDIDTDADEVEYTNLTGNVFTGVLVAKDATGGVELYQGSTTTGKKIVLTKDTWGTQGGGTTQEGYIFKAVTNTELGNLKKDDKFVTDVFTITTPATVAGEPLEVAVTIDGDKYELVVTNPVADEWRLTVAKPVNDVDAQADFTYIKGTRANQNTYVKFGLSNAVDYSDFYGKLWNITRVKDGYVASPNCKGNDFIPADQVALNYPEGQWLYNAELGAFVNRESGEALELAGLRYVEDEENTYTTSDATYTITPAGDPSETATVGYLNGYTEDQLKQKAFFIGYPIASTKDTVWLAKAANGKLEFVEDKTDAVELRLTMADFNAKDNNESVTARNITEYTVWKDKNAGTTEQKNDIVSFHQYTVADAVTGEVLYYNKEQQRFDLGEGKQFNAIVVKNKGSEVYNLLYNVAVTDYDSDSKTYPTDASAFCNAKKLYAANSSNKLAQSDNAYGFIENDMFVVVDADAQQYRGDFSNTGVLDTIKIFRNDDPSYVLYEKGALLMAEDGKTALEGFLGMENINDPKYADMHAAMLADTAYHANTYRPQYMLAVDADIVNDGWTCPLNPEHNTQAWREENGGHCADAVKDRPYIQGRYLVNLVDSFKYTRDVLKVKFDDNKFAHEYYVNQNTPYYRLGFVQAKHIGDSLIIASTNDTIDLKNNPIDKVCTFAFRYVDAERDAFTIETLYDYTPEPDDKNEIKDENRTRGYIKYQNGIPVVTPKASEAWVFDLNETSETPTANETIESAADATISVVAVDGAVIVKGAEGKNVIVSTILGKVVANEVLNSDNETIAAPAGIVVVSVDGESFKVAVK